MNDWIIGNRLKPEVHFLFEMKIIGSSSFVKGMFIKKIGENSLHTLNNKMGILKEDNERWTSVEKWRYLDPPSVGFA